MAGFFFVSATAAGAFFFAAATEAFKRFHQVDDLRRCGLGRDLDLLASDLPLDHVEQRLAVVVFERLGTPRLGEVLDQGLGHLDLLRAELGVRVDRLEVGGPDLVGPVHRLQDEDLVLEPQRSEMLLVAEADLRDADLVLIGECLAQQRVGLRAGLVRDQVVGLLEQDRVDLVEVDELHDVDRAAGFHRHLVEVVVGEDDVAVLLVLVALHDVLEGDLFAVLLAHPLVTDPPVVGVVELVELGATSPPWPGTRRPGS